MSLVEQDTSSKLSVTLTNVDGTAINLSGATVKLKFKIDTSTLSTKTMTIDDAANGKASYVFTKVGSVFDLAAAGTLYYEIEVTQADTTILTTSKISNIEVRKKIS